MPDINGIVDSFAAHLGLTGTSLIATFAILMFICQAIGKAIPEDATGALGFLRKVCKVIGLYVTNRVTSGVTVTDALKNINDHVVPLKQRVDQLASTAVTRGAGGKFQANPFATLIALALLVPLLFGCATPGNKVAFNAGVNAICSNVSTAQSLLILAKESKRKDDFERILLVLQTVCPLVYQQLPPEAVARPN